ncbi:4192_t:CDS:2, partial [Dentiscutata erythropus]
QAQILALPIPEDKEDTSDDDSSSESNYETETSDTPDKVLAMSQLHGEILRKRTRNNFEQLKNQQQDLNSNQEPTIVLPDISFNDNQTEATNLASSTTSNILIQKDSEDISELDADSSSEILTTEQWNSVITDWTDMLDSENHLTNVNLFKKTPLYFEFVGLTVYPANDPLAKWDLATLFNNTLDAPVFLESISQNSISGNYNLT